jgi:hypothetical protein
MSWLLKAVGQAAKRIEPIAAKAATQAKPAIQTAVRTAAKLPAPAKVLGALGATAAGLSMAIAAQHPKAPQYRAVVIDYKPPPTPPPGAKCENRGGAIVCTTVQSQPTEQDKAFWESYRRTQELQKRQDEILQLMRQRIQDWQKVQAMQMQYGRVDPRALAPPPSFSDLEKELADIQKELESTKPQPSPPSKPQPSQPASQPQFQAQSKQLVPTWAAIGAGAAGLAAAVGALLARKPGGLLKIASKPVTEAAAKEVAAKPTIFTPFLSLFRRAPQEAKVSEIAKAARIGEAEKTAMQASSKVVRTAAAKVAARNIVEQATRSANLAKFAKYAKYGAGIGALGLIGYGVYSMFRGAEGAVGAEQAQPEAGVQGVGAGGEAGAQVVQMPQSQIVGGLGGFGGAGAVGGGEAGGEAGVVGTNAGPLGGYVPPAGGYGYVGGGEAGAPQMPGVGGAGAGSVGGLGGFVQSHLLWILGGVALIVIIALLLSRK